MSILDRSKRWGRWFDRLLEVRDSRDLTAIVSGIASDICNLEQKIDDLEQEIDDLKQTLRDQVNRAKSS